MVSNHTDISDDSEVIPGYYRHYKGGRYQVLGTAAHTETDELMVVYRYLYGDYGLSVRPLKMFSETVEVGGLLQPRFALTQPLSGSFSDYVKSTGSKPGSLKPEPAMGEITLGDTGSESAEVRERDIHFMEYALKLAEKAADAGEVPVGAVLVLDEKIVGEGCNQPVSCADPTAHAEIQALRQAGNKLSNYRFPGARLYVTIEPCTMCAGALVHARIEELVFGAFEPRAGAICSQLRMFENTFLNHSIRWRSGVKGEHAAKLIRQFFKARRQ